MILGALGNLGRGKTLSMTFLIEYFLEETKIDYVVTNYETDFTTHYVTSETELEEISNREDFTAIYGLDELWVWMNSRKAQENFDMTDFVINSRKRGALILYTVQNTRQIDPILVDNTDYFIAPLHKEARETKYDHDIIELIILTNEPYEIVNRFVVNAEAYYGVYDTSEEIAGQSTKEKHEKLFNKVKQQVKNGEFETKKEVKAYLSLNHSISQNKSAMIADEIFREVKIEDKIDNENTSSKPQKNVGDYMKS